MKYILIIITIVLVGCNDHSESTIKVAGKLRDIMHNNNVSAKIYPDSIDNENLYGIGALAGLQGEITIVNGKTYASEFIDDTIKTTHSWNNGAVLLVYTNIENWTDGIELQNLTSGSELADFIGKEISENKPIAFLLKGKPKTVVYHIITPDEEDHHSPTHTFTSSGMEVTVVGFYSEDHKGIFTHRDQNVHMHIIDENGHTGHVDMLDPGNMILYIPKNSLL